MSNLSQGGNGKQGADGDVGEMGPRVSIAYIEVFIINLLFVAFSTPLHQNVLCFLSRT